jgi:hypothetical protein
MADVSLLNASNLGNYSKLFLNGGGLLSQKYIKEANENDYNTIAALGGEYLDDIDTPLEIALLSTCAGVVDVRPVEASNMLGNAKQADLKLGAAVYQEMQILRFLGNTAAVGRHEGILKFITDRGNASRAEIESYYRQGIGALIAEAVNTEFNNISFMVETDTDSANVKLIRNPNEYVLICDGFWGNPKKEEIKQFSASSLNALLTVMRNSGNFSATAFNTVRDNAPLIPAVVFDDWKRTTPNMVNPYELLTKALTDFYVTPNEANYKIVRGILARAILASVTDGDAFTDNMAESMHEILVSFNPALNDKINGDISTTSKMIAAAGIPDDPRYGIFTLNRESGDAIFVSKSNPAAARQLMASY